MTQQPHERKRRRARGSGTVYQKHAAGCDRPVDERGNSRCRCVWWFSYRHPDGRRIAESAESSRKGDAERLLQRRVGAKANNLAVIPRAEKLTFYEAAQAVIDDFTVNKKRSLKTARRKIEKHLLPYFGPDRLIGITADRINAYVVHRQAQGIVAVRGQRKGQRVGDVSNGAINRELALLKRVFSLAVRNGRIATRPHIAMLRESSHAAGSSRLISSPAYWRTCLTRFSR